MNLYYVGDNLTAKIKVDKGARLTQVDALMARDGMKRCDRKTYLKEKAGLNDPQQPAAAPPTTENVK